ncbi:hypothetical protein [Methylocystis hirsuta]|nr:hypothetical protein [Methylocystis hirsuta]
MAAKDLGVKMAISTDAHSSAGLAYMRYGVTKRVADGWSLGMS